MTQNTIVNPSIGARQVANIIIDEPQTPASGAFVPQLPQVSFFDWDKMCALQQAMTDLAAPREFADLLKLMVEHVARLLSARHSAVYLYNQKANVLDLFVTFGNATFPSQCEFGKGTIGTAAQIRRSFFGQDYKDPKAPKGLETNLDLVAAPIVYGNELIGVVAAGGPENGLSIFCADDMQVLDLYLIEAATSTYTSRLLEQVSAGRERMQVLSRRLLEVQEQERRTIARELHDEVGQSLSCIQLNLQALKMPVQDNCRSTKHMIQDTIKSVEQVLSQVRDLSLNLRPSILDDFGLVPALKWLIDNQNQRNGLRIQLNAPATDERYPQHMETVCFRVVQEALTNIRRHAHAHTAQVTLDGSDHELKLVISDDGIGFNVAQAMQEAVNGASLGLLGLRERVMLAGGQIEFASTPGQGTRIQVHLPMVSSAHVERRSQERPRP